MGRFWLLLWVAVAVAFAPLGSFAHARGHDAPQMHHHHAGDAHHHHHHELDAKICKDCDGPAKSEAVKDCCQLGCQLLLAHVSPDVISLTSSDCTPPSLALQHHAGIEPAQSDPPPRA